MQNLRLVYIKWKEGIWMYLKNNRKRIFFLKKKNLYHTEPFYYCLPLHELHDKNFSISYVRPGSKIYLMNSKNFYLYDTNTTRG